MITKKLKSKTTFEDILHIEELFFIIFSYCNMKIICNLRQCSKEISNFLLQNKEYSIMKYPTTTNEGLSTYWSGYMANCHHLIFDKTFKSQFFDICSNLKKLEIYNVVSKYIVFRFIPNETILKTNCIKNIINLKASKKIILVFPLFFPEKDYSSDNKKKIVNIKEITIENYKKEQQKKYVITCSKKLTLKNCDVDNYIIGKFITFKNEIKLFKSKIINPITINCPKLIIDKTTQSNLISFKGKILIIKHIRFEINNLEKNKNLKELYYYVFPIISTDVKKIYDLLNKLKIKLNIVHIKRFEDDNYDKNYLKNSIIFINKKPKKIILQ
jgi:hypothetical protein